MTGIIDSDTSRIILGCILSGPGDLETFSPFSLFKSLSAFMLRSVSGGVTNGRGDMKEISPGGSFSSTSEKYSDSTSACSFSFVVLVLSFLTRGAI